MKYARWGTNSCFLKQSANFTAQGSLHAVINKQKDDGVVGKLSLWRLTGLLYIVSPIVYRVETSAHLYTVIFYELLLFIVHNESLYINNMEAEAREPTSRSGRQPCGTPSPLVCYPLLVLAAPPHRHPSHLLGIL